MEKLLFFLSVLLTTACGINTCCDISSNTITDSQLHDCLLQELSLDVHDNGYSNSAYNSYDSLAKASSLSIDVVFNYLISMNFNRQWDSAKFIFLDSWKVDFSDKEQLFFMLTKSPSIILHYSNEISSIINQDSWNLMVSDELILFRSNHWTINLLTSWREHSQRSQPDFHSFIGYFHSHFTSPKYGGESIFPDSVLFLNSSVLFQSLHTSITSIEDPSRTPLFLLGNISSVMDSFERNILVPHVWKAVCSGSSPELLEAFVSFEKKVLLEIRDAMSRLFAYCKMATSIQVTPL
jgi:hypothetical protein